MATVQPSGTDFSLSTLEILASPSAVVADVETLVFSATPTLTKTPQPMKFSQYDLQLELDYAAHWAGVHEKLEYVNNSGVTLNEILLLVEPNRSEGVFKLNHFVIENHPEDIAYKLDGALLTVHLPQPLLPSESIVFDLSFELFLPFDPGVLGYSRRQLNLANWYVMEVPMLEGDWQIYPPAYVGENLLYPLGDYQVELRLENTSNLQIAAPAVPKSLGSLLRYSKTNARNFTFSFSPEYQVLQIENHDWQAAAYVFPEHVEAGKDALNCAVQAYQLYSELFGDFHLQTLVLVESEFPDGMEYDGFFFLNQAYFAYYPQSPASGLCALCAHETAHQWWYRVAANDQALEPWLDEALCTYSELIFYERLYPELVPWWREYRISAYQPQGWVDSSIYAHDEYRPYVNAVYLNGVQFLDELRGCVGDQVFLQGLADYAEQNQFDYVRAEDFFEAVPADPVLLRPILEKYFLSVNAIDLPAD